MRFSTRQIPALQGMSHTQRQQALANALGQLSATQRFTLNVCKLLLITPVFYILAKVEGWVMLPWLLIAGLAYPLLLAPLNIFFASSHLEKANCEELAGKKGS